AVVSSTAIAFTLFSFRTATMNVRNGKSGVVRCSPDKWRRLLRSRGGRRRSRYRGGAGGVGGGLLARHRSRSRPADGSRAPVLAHRVPLSRATGPSGERGRVAVLREHARLGRVRGGDTRGGVMVRRRHRLPRRQ